MVICDNTHTSRANKICWDSSIKMNFGGNEEKWVGMRTFWKVTLSLYPNTVHFRLLLLVRQLSRPNTLGQRQLCGHMTQSAFLFSPSVQT